MIMLLILGQNTMAVIIRKALKINLTEEQKCVIPYC